MPSDKTIRSALCHAIHTATFTGHPTKPDINAYITSYQCRKDSQVIKLYHSGMSYRQIRDLLDIPISTVQSIIERGKNT